MDRKVVFTFLIGASVLVSLSFLGLMESNGQKHPIDRQPAFKSSHAVPAPVEHWQTHRQTEQLGQVIDEREHSHQQKYHGQPHSLQQLYHHVENSTSGKANTEEDRRDRDGPLSSPIAPIISTSAENHNGNDVDVVVDEGKTAVKDEMGRGAEGRDDAKQALHTGGKGELAPEHGLAVWNNTPAELLQMVPEIFRKVPRQFDPRYKNPCWLARASYNNGSGSGEILNCLPYFYIIGFPKCGTTELWDKLTAHPDVLGTVPKEPHWWARRRLGWTATPIHRKEVLRIRAMTGDKDDRSFDWYLNLYNVYATKAIQSNTLDTDHADSGKEFHHMVFGDASVSTAWDRGLKTAENNLSTIDLMRAVQPTAKIIMIVRNPADRDYSGFYYTGGKNPKKFGNKMGTLIKCFRTCLSTHPEKYCTYVQRKCGLMRSLYVVHAEEWMKAYGERGVYVLRLEDWHANPAEEYQKLLTFLDLRTLDDKEVDAIIHRRPKNVNAAKTGKKPMLESTRHALNEFYRPYNSRLAQLLNNSRYDYQN